MDLIIITHPEFIADEALICNSLFAAGLKILHLRKPGADSSAYAEFIDQIEPCYRDRITLHDHYELAEKYQLHGIHIKYDKAKEYINSGIKNVSVSCHSFGEIEHLPFRPAYCFLSPVFDSISKEGYKRQFSEKELRSFLSHQEKHLPPVIALGGVTPDNLRLCEEYGFQGAAVLGYLWQKPEEALQRYIRLKTPFTMSIAGFDPSAGAGVMADIKTFEALGTYGLGISSAITFQNEDTYTGTQWISIEAIRRQCELQFRHHRPRYIKIGLIENFEVLDALTEYLTATIPDVRIIWDPILKASAGFIFHADSEYGKLRNILDRLYLITPNSNELQQLFGKETEINDLQSLCRQYRLNVLWKGGHNDEQLSSDRLVTPEDIYMFSVSRGNYDKHGTGCVLSSAIASGLANGLDLPESCNLAQQYVSRFMDSNDSVLGYHPIHNYIFHKPSLLALKIQYITDFKKGTTICGQIEAVCRGGMRWVQLRMKEAGNETILKEGQLAAEICRRYNALFIINDNVNIARQLNADGVHLGKEDMNPVEARRILGPGKIIGATCNTWEDVLERAAQKVDYIGLGPFTFTTTKKKLSPVLGMEGYRNICSKMREAGINIPVFAIGGITETDIPLLMQTGIQGIALSGLIKNSPDITEKTKEVIRLTEC